jgi:pimeloyl-ACP methyl ester carboxylesterase
LTALCWYPAPWSVLWIWDRLRDHLDSSTLAPELPSRTAEGAGRSAGLHSTAAELVEAVEGPDLGRVLLVGHSLGGAVVWEAASVLGSRVAGLVFVAAEVPPPGRSWLDEQSPVGRAGFRAAWMVRPNGIKPPGFVARRVLCNDLDEEDTRLVVGRLRPEPRGMYTERQRSDARPDLHTCYVRTTEDRAVSLDRQDEMAGRVGADEILSIPAGHLPMLARPRDLAGALRSHPALTS